MPTYLYWGDDDFAMAKAANTLRESVLDPNWASFNYDKIAADRPDAIIFGLNQAMTPPFGMGKRLVWLAETTLTQHCEADLLAELARTLPVIPESTVLLLTSRNKPDGRLKSTKLLKDHASVEEFALIPPWKTELLIERVQQVSAQLGLKLTASAVELLAESIGNDTRQLYSEVEKLQLYAAQRHKPIDAAEVSALVSATAQTSLQLASAIRAGQTAQALGLVAELLQRNEPALKIVATLIGVFRTWLWVKLMVDSKERDERAIAQAAEVANPKRIYFLRQEVSSLTLIQLQKSCNLLLELDFSLKRGAEEISTLQSQIVQLCATFSKSSL